MRTPRIGSQRHPGRIGSDARGASAVEFALAAPVLITVLVGILEFGLLMFAQNSMTHVARDAARRVSVGEIATASAVTSYVRGELAIAGSWGNTVSVNTTMPTSSAQQVTIVLSVPMATVAAIAPLHLFSGTNLSVTVVARTE